MRLGLTRLDSTPPPTFCSSVVCGCSLYLSRRAGSVFVTCARKSKSMCALTSGLSASRAFKLRVAKYSSFIS